MTTRAKRSRASKASSQNSKALENVVRAVRCGRRFLVATHRNPDGDALGSALALGAGLRKLGKAVKVYNADSVPRSLRFLPGSERITSVLKSEEVFDAAFVVDCSDLSRVGDVFLSHPGLGATVVLDHHARGRHDGDVLLNDPKAASSGVVVHRVLRRLGVKITKDIAIPLYVTLMTDTGDFRYANTSAGVLELAAELVRGGASPDEISRAVHSTAPPERLKLLASALETLELFDQGRIGVVAVTRRMLRKTGAALDVSDDFVDYPRSLQSVEIAILFRETDRGWRVSLRSKAYADVGAVAVRLGGGGHIRAAGFTSDGSFATVKRRTLAAVRQEIRKYPVYKQKTAC